jgi:hypothetical protein
MPHSKLSDKINQFLFEFDEGYITEYQMAHLIMGVVYGWLKDAPDPEGENNVALYSFPSKAQRGPNDPDKR